MSRDAHPKDVLKPEAGEEDRIAGDRGASTLSAGRSLQSRISNMLAIGLISSLGLGLLGWYYARTFTRPAMQKHLAQTASQSQAEGDLPLPALGKIDPPASTLASVLGPKPDEPPAATVASGIPLTEVTVYPSGPVQPPVKSPEQLALERRLAGPVSTDRATSASTGLLVPAEGDTAPVAMRPEPLNASLNPQVATETPLSARLRPSVTPAATARVLPTQRLLLPKGAFIDCTLETALNSSLPGMATCITATDTFGADGQVVLLERGTKLVGESAGTVQQGVARMFVLWTEARTPTGVVIPLASPGTDELGRSGLSGSVNRHFFERFGAALLITMIDGAVQRAATSQNGGGTVIYNPSSSQDVMTEVLKSTVNIPPTIDKPQGDRIQILVARDLDFRSVYELRSNQRP
jgi:type IV secretion system protein VirB10